MHRACSAHDDIAEFEQFKEEVIDVVRKDLRSGMSASELRKKWLPVLEAKRISLGLLESDAGKQNQIVKDITDREEGRPKEQKKIEHRFSELPDDELEAIIQTKLKDASYEKPN